MICSCKNGTGVITPEMAPHEEDANAPMDETDNSVWTVVQNFQTNAMNSLRSLYPLKESDNSETDSVDEVAEKSSYTFCGVV
jgi:hypothetical protein